MKEEDEIFEGNGRQRVQAAGNGRKRSGKDSGHEKPGKSG